MAALAFPAGFTCREGEIKSTLLSEELVSARIGWKPGDVVRSGEELNSTGCQAGAGGELHLHCTRLAGFRSMKPAEEANAAVNQTHYRCLHTDCQHGSLGTHGWERVALRQIQEGAQARHIPSAVWADECGANCF